MKKKLLCLLCLILISSYSYAQDGFRGLVLDPEGVPVAEALVVMSDSLTNAELHILQTDSLGRYSVPECPAVFNLKVNAFGFESHSSTVRIADIPDRLVSVSLSWFTKDAVVIRGQSKPRMMLDGNKFVVDKIENSPFAKGNNAYSFFRYIPVLNVPVFEGEIAVLGGGNAILHINGRRSNMSMEAVLKNTPAESIERIEIIAVPGSEYSASSQGASIINVVMKRRPDEGMKYSLYLQGTHERVSRQNGSFTVNYSGNKTFITSGVNIRNYNDYSKATESRRFYNDDRQSHIESISRLKTLSSSAYFNIDRELDKRNTIGMRISTSLSNQRNTDDATTDFSRFSDGYMDSTFLSSVRTTTPNKFSGLNVNLNYNLKADDKGSTLLVDLDYASRKPNSRIHNVSDKNTPAGLVRQRDFIQKENTDLDAFGVITRYNHVFNPKTRLNSGISLNGALTNLDFFHGDYYGDGYVNNPNYSNVLSYDDITLAVYTSLQHNWSEKFTTVFGLRMESYHARGEQKTTGEEFSRHNTGLYPSVTVNYSPSGNHILSMNVTRTILHPNYSRLNPFRTYTGANTYTKGNPYLKSIEGWRGNFSYNFFKDFSLGISAMYLTNPIGDFTLADENNEIMHTYLNYGKSIDVTPYISASKTLFNGYWYISCDFSNMYNLTKGTIDNIERRVENWMPSLSVSNNVTFSKKARLSAYLRYNFVGSMKSIVFKTNDYHAIQFSLEKRFENSSLTFGFNKRLSEHKVYNELPDFGYALLRQDYWRWYASYSVTFGNTKARSVGGRTNSNISDRLE